MMSNIYSFENELPQQLTAGHGSATEISTIHQKDGKSALLWTFERNSYIEIKQDIDYAPLDMSGIDKALDTFALWVCTEGAIDGYLNFAFIKDGVECCGFNMGLDFTGWRTAWVAYERDMHGTPVGHMDTVRISARTTKQGKLWIDQLIVLTKVDARYHMRDAQLPFVNFDADNTANAHWMSLYKFDWLSRHTAQVPVINEADCAEIAQRFEAFALNVCQGRSAKALAQLQAAYSQYSLASDGISGRSVDGQAHLSVFPAAQREELIALTNSIDISDTGALLLDMAYFCHTCKDAAAMAKVKQMYVSLTRHLLHQGFAYGSGLGTMHHFGYPMRLYYYAMFLMRDTLEAAGLRDDIAKAMGWISGYGRIFRDDEGLSKESMDTLNTLSHGILASVLMIKNSKRRASGLTAIGHWLSICMLPAPGVEGPFKIDGCSFHHCNHYPAYALGGITSIAPLVYMLSGTAYSISEAAHYTIRKALLTMRIYCNTYNWPVALSSRHPVGKGEYSSIGTLSPFYYLAMAGAPDKSSVPDKEMAAAYMRLTEYMPNAKALPYNIEAECAPNGHWSLNYGCIALHRRREWLACVRGHSRYIWANESYVANNLYGRYVAHGNLQILSKGAPINNTDSGYVQEGWDWNNWPGTTAIHLPLDELRSNVCNVDTLSGFEEMLISDETYCGGADMDGDGVFAMKLHEHPKYNGSHRAKKSYFFFDDMIICLGTDIENTNTNPTETTMFQTHVGDGDSIVIDGEVISELGYKSEISLDKPMLIADDKNNGYMIPAGQTVLITRGVQHSRAQNTEEPTQGVFSKAVLCHGAQPQGGKYHYAILVDCAATRLNEQCLAKDAPMYNVISMDSRIHAVKCKDTTACAVFCAGKINIGSIVAIDTPCLIMAKEQAKHISLAVADPDLRLYEGIEKDQYDENGVQKEVSLYSRKWRGAKSIPHTLTITLSGEWCTKAQSDGVEATLAYNNTQLTVICCDGLVQHIELEKL